MILILKHRFKKLKKSQKYNVLLIFDLKLDNKIKLVVSFRQCKDVTSSKDYSVVIHLISVVNDCCRLQLENYLYIYLNLKALL